MSLKRKPQRRSSRRDTSSFPFPAAVPVEVQAGEGGVGVVMVSEEPIILNPVNISEDGQITKVTGIKLIPAAGPQAGQVLPIQLAEQLDPYSIQLGNISYAGGTLTFTGTVTMGPNIDGIRSSRGGMPVLGQLVFP